VRLRGYLTMSAGLLLALLTAFQSVRLRHLALHEAARDEARGLAASLRARLDLDRALLDLNAASMREALGDLGRWPHPLEWAGLYRAARSDCPAASAGTGEDGVPGDEDLRRLAAAAPEDLPLLRSLGGGRYLAMDRLRIGDGELALAMLLAPEGARPGSEGLWSAMSACLLGVAAAACLLIWHGATDVLGARAAARPGRRPPRRRPSRFSQLIGRRVR
jgi:hypothetical protein